MTQLLASELARRFWQAAGEPEPLPRELRRAVAFALPLGVVDLPRLRLAGLDAWLTGRGIRAGLALSSGPKSADRPLRAGLVAFAGKGFVFLDGTDPDHERRFSLAHEVAHFLADYWWPRTRAERRVGRSSLEVLDGRRPPTAVERIDAVLAKASLESHVHLMERTADGHFPGTAISRAERTADALAFELLAPIEVVRAGMDSGSTRASLAAALNGRFGLPWQAAHVYARQLVGDESSRPSLVRRLFDNPG